MQASHKLPQQLSQALEVLRDSRQEGKIQHNLVEILFIIISALICGAESFIEIAQFAQSKRRWLENYLDLSCGIPSHDTFERVVSLINPESVEKIFIEWAKTLPRLIKKNRLSIDGKAIRGTERTFGQGKRPVQELNIYDNGNRIAIGQLYAQSSGIGELQAVLDGIELIDLRRGTLISLDAGPIHFSVPEMILKKGGYYLFPLKKNNRPSYWDLEDFFYKVPEKEAIFEDEEKYSSLIKGKIDFCRTIEINRGRYEERICTVASAKNLPEKFRSQWKDVKSIIRIHRIRRQKSKATHSFKKLDAGGIKYIKNPKKYKISEETIYYISNKVVSAKTFLNLIREHWSIESALHWTLDVAFHEDDWRVENKRIAHNLAVLRKIAFNLIRQDPAHQSTKVKIKEASWNEEYLEKILFSTFDSSP